MRAFGPGHLCASARNLIAPGVAGALICLVLLSGCATTGQETVTDGTSPAQPAANAPPTPAPAASKPAQDDSRDPLEDFNRSMYDFNQKLDDHVMKPVARAYRETLPSAMRTGISNFFNNLREPIVIVNDLLQGKLVQTLSDLGRFVTNTTIGILGLFDPATSLGLVKHYEDFGQTLGVWGVGEGPYIVWPVFGPSNLRDTGGDLTDWYLWVPTYAYRQDEISNVTRNTLFVLELIPRRERLLDATDILDQAGGEDPYIFVREAYRQNRRKEVYDGNPPREVPEGLFEDEPAPAPPAKP
jgi:phospholipid-binding lipoprotein MlaA